MAWDRLSLTVLQFMVDWARARPEKAISPITTQFVLEVLARLGLRHDLLALIAPEDMSSVLVAHTESREMVLYQLLRLIIVFTE
jgi:hypothetical protein